MSQENVQVVRAVNEAWERGGIDAAAEFWDPQIDWRSAEGALDDVGAIRGVEAMRAYVQDWLDDFDDVHFELEELIEAGEQVVAVQRVTARARASGVATELRYTVVNTIRDGKVVRSREYWTRDEALAAVGLSE